MKTVLLALLSVCVGLPALSQGDVPLRRLLSADEARAWHAVGRVNMQGEGFCTGALIAPDLVLTAAHCMFFRKTGRRIPAEQIHFLAGWRKGWAAAHRRARRVVLHGDYDFGEANAPERVGTDIALIELDTPIRSSVVTPFPWEDRPAPGAEVQVVSYAQERSEVPALQERCHVLARQSDILITSCDVNSGASGAPIFVQHDDGPRVVSVVSSMAQWKNTDVALGTSLGAPLEALMRQLAETGAVFKSVRPAAGVVRLPQVTGAGAGPKIVSVPE